MILFSLLIFEALIFRLDRANESRNH